MEVAFVSSSLVTENSYSLDSDKQLGVLISDRWTHWVDEHLDKSNVNISIGTLMDRVGRENLMSNIGRHTTMSVPLSQVAAKDFLMDPQDPAVLVKTVVKPLSETTAGGEKREGGVVKAGLADGERAGSVAAQEFKLVDPEVCRAIGAAAVLLVVAAGGASSLA